MLFSVSFLYYFFVLFLRCHIWCYHVDILSSFNGIIFWLSSFSFYVLWSQGDINEIFSSGLYWSWKMNLFLFTRPSFDIMYNGYNVNHKKKKEVMKVIIFCSHTKIFLYFLWETEIFPFQLVQFLLIQFFRSYV